MSEVCILSKIQQIHPFVPQRKALPSCLSPSAENNSSRPGRSISDAKCLLRWTPSHFQLTKCFSRGSFTGTFRRGDVRARSPCLLSLSRIKLRAFHGLGASQKKEFGSQSDTNQKKVHKTSQDSVIPAGCHTCGWQPDVSLITNFHSNLCLSTASSNWIDQVFQPDSTPNLGTTFEAKDICTTTKVESMSGCLDMGQWSWNSQRWLRWLK